VSSPEPRSRPRRGRLTVAVAEAGSTCGSRITGVLPASTARSGSPIREVIAVAPERAEMSGVRWRPRRR